MIDEALLRVLSSHTGRPQTFAQPPVAMTGGFWAAIYSFELDQPPPDLRGPLVLRVMPSREAAFSETIVQRTVADQGYSTPRVVLDGVDAGLGGAFMIMERSDGVALLAGLNIGRALLGMPKLLRAVASQLSNAMVRLHDLDPQPVATAFDRAGIDASTLGVEARLNEIRAAARATSCGFAGVLQWLEQRRPDLNPVVVCHGDIHPFNMLTTPNGTFSVLDWTNATLCRREYDVGCTAALLHCAPVEAPRFARRPIGMMTATLAKRFVDSYRKRSPINLDVVEWFETLQYGRCLAAAAMAPMINDGILSENHPFRTSAPAMIRQVRLITDVAVDLGSV